MLRRNLLVLLVITCAGTSLAEDLSLGPVIEHYGPTYAIPELDVPLPGDFTFRTVFDIAQDPAPGTVNRNFVSVARFLNMHARNGVPLENMKMAIVVHGKAIRNLLDVLDNPNLDLIAVLQEAGVEIYICGQSMTHAGILKSELADGVQVALSAMTMLTILQADGYALLPWGG